MRQTYQLVIPEVAICASVSQPSPCPDSSGLEKDFPEPTALSINASDVDNNFTNCTCKLKNFEIESTSTLEELSNKLPTEDTTLNQYLIKHHPNMPIKFLQNSKIRCENTLSLTR